MGTDQGTAVNALRIMWMFISARFRRQLPSGGISKVRTIIRSKPKVQLLATERGAWFLEKRGSTWPIPVRLYRT
ncbi:predicted protein [Coccidioides posadasii str. Silveira]|uniref:Predicted protein n=1 Tax=Coccidioides posadasii (strain RMSCC 757 / Silveira) TaxID=443226 RepID=E9D5V4_COCPS|nr:predicted protein [Coccidioides posadasii str. Silveira]